MSNPTDIKTEFETIATAQVGVNTFVYGYPWDLNRQFDITYPLCMLQTIREATYPSRKNKYKVYTIVVGFYDDYLEAEKVGTDWAAKQTELETLGIQFLQEFDSRSKDSGNWYRLTGDSEELPNAEFMEMKADQNLAGYELTFQLQVPDECTDGTFNY